MANQEDEKVSLREYVDVNFDLRDRALKIQTEAQEQALSLATRQLESRLNLLNELRGNVLTKAEFDGFEKDSNRRIEALEKWQAKLVGVAIVIVLFSGLIGAAIMRLFSR